VPAQGAGLRVATDQCHYGLAAHHDAIVLQPDPGPKAVEQLGLGRHRMGCSGRDFGNLFFAIHVDYLVFYEAIYIHSLPRFGGDT
jgi:hypothetical protein